MNLRDLEYILAVATYKSFSLGAKSCHVSQPSLSAQIRKVEDELGVRIFERDSRHVLLTNYGSVFIEKAQRILDEVEGMRSLARQSLDPFDGVFRMGAIATVAPYFFPTVLKKVKARAPRLQLELKEGQTAQLVENLLSGELDAAILSLPTDQTLFESLPLFVDPFLLAVPEGHRLAKLKEVKEADLKDEKLILLDEGHCLRLQALDLCVNSAIQEDRAFRASSLETIRHIVATNEGITLMPSIARKNNDGIVYVPMKNDTYKRTIGLVWRKSTSRKQLISALGQGLAS